MTLEENLSTAAAHHSAGELADAERMYREILSSDPENRLASIRLGDVLSDARRTTEAAACYRRVIERAPNDAGSADAYDGLAAILQDQGRLDDAITASLKAIELRRDADAAYVLGSQLQKLGGLMPALRAFQLAVKLRPDFAEAHARIGAIHIENHQALEAITAYQSAIAARPAFAEAHCNLANALQLAGQDEQALISARRALELNPQLAEAHNVMGVILRHRRRPADALEAFVRAVKLKQDYAQAINNVGAMLEQMGRISEAHDYFQQAVNLRPQTPDFHMNLACNLLIRGDYARGWAEYEWRRQKPKNAASRNFGRPQWDGSDLAGKTILIHAEQGIGDTIQFARYLPMVRDRGGRVIVECQAPIAPLIARIDGVQQVINQGEAWPTFDVHCPLISLPLMFNTTLETIPQRMPYVVPDPARVAEWASKIPPRDGSRRIGLSWAGNPRHPHDRNRSCPPSQLEPLAALPGITLFSLQKNPVTPAPPSLGLVDLTAGLHDFGDTAALVSHLDLVLTVDTALAHLAGAMAKPVWVAMPFVPDWRWLTDRTDSPWYPTARLFRQPIPADWSSVFKIIAEELQKK